MLWFGHVSMKFLFFIFIFFNVLLKVGTLCCLGCLSGSRLKSKYWSPPTWGRVFASPAQRTETSQCGAEEQCWPTCAPSALHGSARKNMRSMDRRLSSGSASETDCWKVCTLDSNNELRLFHQVQYSYSLNAVAWIGQFFKYLSVFFDELMSIILS